MEAFSTAAKRLREVVCHEGPFLSLASHFLFLCLRVLVHKGKDINSQSWGDDPATRSPGQAWPGLQQAAAHTG